MKNPFEKYIKKFSEVKLWDNMAMYAKKAGIKAVYTVLLLYYAYARKETPSWAKRIVLGTLGYLVSPIDLIPDLSPLIGYTDDIGVLSFGLITIAAFVNEEVKNKAKGRLTKWFGDYDPKELAEVDDQL
ncbi:MAG: YkvA family protein [Saprospiraceae bacterium]|nr:YkvA family protein [Saprospiraceae bacterium]